VYIFTNVEGINVSSAVGSRVQRKRYRVRSNLAAVADRKLKKDVTTTNPNPDSKCGGHLSDDSIGMLSPLNHFRNSKFCQHSG
jgi:hypothetical protein